MKSPLVEIKATQRLRTAGAPRRSARHHELAGLASAQTMCRLHLLCAGTYLFAEDNGVDKEWVLPRDRRARRPAGPGALVTARVKTGQNAQQLHT